MNKKTALSLVEQLKQIPDPRVKRTRRHEFMSIMVIALCATICGADNWVGVVQFGKAKIEWLSTFLELPNGIPSHDTFGRVFQILDSAALERVCIEWLQSIAGTVEGVVSIDGKSLCGSRDGERSPLHLVSAWAHQNSLLLGQVQTDKKSNEITAIPQLLKLLVIENCIVTIDAMGCQKAITKEIVDAKADYALTLKSNHPHLHSQVEKWYGKCLEDDFAHQAHDYFEESASVNNHGRIEQRQYWLITVPEHLQATTKSWTNLNTLAMVKRTRQIGEKISNETHYYISSLPLSAGAKKVANAIRSHWSVENNLHWSLDVAFNEDACRVRKDEGPANLACLRRIAQTQLRRETSLKVGMANKRARAGWDQNYLLKVLALDVLQI